jgi:hypothetical protein
MAQTLNTTNLSPRLEHNATTLSQMRDAAVTKARQNSQGREKSPIDYNNGFKTTKTFKSPSRGSKAKFKMSAL